MRRHVTYALGGHFIALHKSMLFLSGLGVSLDSLAVPLVDLRTSLDVPASLFDAQAAQIRVGVLFSLFCVRMDSSTFMRRLRTYATSVDTVHFRELSLMRRLRRSVSVSYFNVFVFK